MTGERRERGEREREEEKIMPSLMATSLRWRTHSAWTNMFLRITATTAMYTVQLFNFEVLKCENHLDLT